MPPTTSTIRRIQMLQGEIAELRRQGVLLRGALAEIVTMSTIEKARNYALAVLTAHPAPPDPPQRRAPPTALARAANAANDGGGDGATDPIGDGDVGAAGGAAGSDPPRALDADDPVMVAYRAAWGKGVKDH